MELSKGSKKVYVVVCRLFKKGSIKFEERVDVNNAFYFRFVVTGGYMQPESIVYLYENGIH